MKLVSIALFIFLFFSYNASSQQRSNALNAELLQTAFSEYNYHPAPKRRMMSLENRSLMGKVNPVNYVSAGLLFFYQNVLSEQIQASCMYEISCSNYTKLSIEKSGLKGFFLGINQLNNCFPGVIYDYPKHLISKDGKVINEIE
jgi:uncharacterized protein